MQNKQEYAAVKQFPALPGLTLMQASYVTQSFARHSHDGFAFGVIDDTDLASEIHSFHISLSTGTLQRLEMESRLLHMVIRFIRRHADMSYPLLKAGREHPAVLAATRMMEDLSCQDISLAGLAAESGLSPFHLIRVFKAQTGFTPHRYLSQVRVRRAEQLIRQGVDLADTAYEVGFADQSHLNRHFKGIAGITPGAYRNFVQDAAC